MARRNGSAMLLYFRLNSHQSANSPGVGQVLEPRPTKEPQAASSKEPGARIQGSGDLGYRKGVRDEGHRFLAGWTANPTRGT